MEHRRSRRGRPASGTAMTPAERKQRERERERALIWGEAIGVESIPLEVLTMEGLVDGIRKATAEGHTEMLRHLTREALRRAEEKRLTKKTADNRNRQ